MILETNDDLRKYISISDNFTFETFEPYITKAINGYTKKYVGKLHEFLDLDDTSSTAEIKNEAREHLRSSIANFGYFLFTPYNSITMDSSGMANVVNENRKNIDWWQLNDIRRELLRSGHESMDLLLTILESNPDVFEDWTTEFGVQNTDLLVHNASEFQKVYNIFNSRQTYLSLVPVLTQIQDQYINTYICHELLVDLKQQELTGSLLFLKQYLQKAIIHFSIAKIYDEGIFNLDASGIKLKFDMLPNETIKAIDYGKYSDQLNRAIKKNIDNGNNYMGLAKSVIIDNPDDFLDYPNPLNQKNKSKFNSIKGTGIVGF